MSSPLIFDTSIWIDFFRERNNPASNLLTKYIERDDPVILVPVIILEILQGIREDVQFSRVRDSLTYFTVLQTSAVQAAIGAAELYRSLRKKGLTIRKSNDCLIAFYAIEFSIPLVHADADFDLISSHSKLKVYQPAA